MTEKTKANSNSQKELQKIDANARAYEESLTKMTLDNMNMAPKAASEPQKPLSQADIAKSNDIYLKPNRSISSREKFNEEYRDQYNHAKEYVHFMAEHKEIIGETIEIWTKPFAGMPAEFWKVPTGKPVWGPRYLAEQIKRAQYHRFRTEDNIVTGGSRDTQFYGGMIVDQVVQRLDAQPVSTRQSIFMGAQNF